jgi:hypothetical protein
MMLPEEKIELLQMLLSRGVQVRTFRKSKRIVAVEKTDGQVVVHYEDGSIDKMHIRDFIRRRFVVVI